MFFKNLLKRLTEYRSDKSWIEQLRPIVKDFKNENGTNEPLTPQEVERLSSIIRFKIDLEEGNLNNKEIEDIVNHGPTFH